MVARVWFSSLIFTRSFASTAWWRPSDQRRPSRMRPVNSSMIFTSPSNRVVDVALVERLGLQRLDQVVDEVAVLGEVEVLDAEELLRLLDAALGDGDGLMLLVRLEVEVG